MGNTESVEVSESSQKLIGVQLHEDEWNSLFHFVVMFNDSMNCFRDVVHNHIQVNFIGFVTLSEKSMSKSYDVGVIKFTNDLDFTVFVSLIL